MRLSARGRRTGGKTRTPKKRIVPLSFRSKRQTRPKCFLLYCRWSFPVHHRPSNAAPAAARYCVKAEQKPRCASPGELQEHAAVWQRLASKWPTKSGHFRNEFPCH